ncbi:LLM class flavin-dependent oxidoreductase [Kitasatospora viridis]|uniref:Alkanesulfonate monooxygenase SsuD/methylene tetrahydromethanopterin reductase-like flavin-dependent oxidoreductase (Luciferase family) n=1 Tax=Kitasatospora viridis TaxID=281105 RepID=A0A561SFN1_9ACTN|nr:LLM class flavin-dependent oxidoreductase [Kitasatospora viridis]TWF73638.1 alkanesulfonate monooxygenase SsuD/methylene tetrahydromethanopterin reductase-like flavin-dependent oxidoreductase (luciferase family) [Kitasatospora viridis]
MSTSQHLHLAAALDGAGWHPAARHQPQAAPRPFTLDHWAGQARQAEDALLDFVTVEDPLSRAPGPGEELDRRLGHTLHRLDALTLAGALAARTTRLGIIPTVVVNTVQPAPVAKAIATLDHLSAGRAGLRTQLSPTKPIPLEVLFTPEVQAQLRGSFDRAADLVKVVRALWDGVTEERALAELVPGRFAGADSAGDWEFSPTASTAPRPPQGHPVVFTLAHISIPWRYGAQATDVVSVTPHDLDEVRAAVAEIREEQQAVGRAGQRVHVFADLLVHLDAEPGAAKARRERLDEALGAEHASDTLVFTGTPAELADLLQDWQSAGLTGYRLRPASTAHDLPAIATGLVPELQRRGAFRTGYAEDTLRERLALGTVAP